MVKILLTVILSFLLFACTSEADAPVAKNEPKNSHQWINPIFYNDDFDPVVSFPIWFDDSLVRHHNISKITKRIFPRIIGDTSSTNSQKDAMPREKREFYFATNGHVERMVVYYYYDDREIARASFNYDGKIDKNGFAKATPGVFQYLSDQDGSQDYRTDLQAEREYNFVKHQFLREKKKYVAYEDLETHEKLFLLKDRKYWGPLSVDSILKPGKEDWIIWGSIWRPFKFYKVENKVKEKNVHYYKYWSTGALKERIIENYPFENRRSYQYNAKNTWISYVDSLFSENVFISRTTSNFEFDQYDRPILLNHQKEGNFENPMGYIETFSYQTKR